MPWLVCTHGDDKGLVEELTNGKPTLIGRQESCDLRLMQASVSRRHCEITMVGSILNIEDLGSSHGVKYKGKRYKGKSVKIKSGGVFDISGDRFMFAYTYEQYVDVTDKIKNNVHSMNDQEMKANYSKLIAEAASTRTMKMPRRSFLDKLKDTLTKPL